MVTQAYYDEEEPSFRRYSSRGLSYPTIQDRSFSQTSMESNHGSRGYHASSHDTRGSDQGSEQDSQKSRRRIQVACGRCRKRKIRCTGPTEGGSGSCTSCKTAGNDHCQFLRVSSTETQMKSELADLSYDPAGTRQLLRMMPQYGGNYTHTYPQQVSQLSSEGWAGNYRANSLSTYPYHVKNQHGLPSYQTEFPDVDGSGVDYSVHGTNYQLQNQEYIGGTPYNVPGGSRWVTAPQSKHLPLFPEQNSPPPYTHEQLPCSGNGYALRPTISPDGKSYVSSNLPGPSQISGNDRMLPYPAVNRPVQQNGSYLRSSDILPSSQSSYQNYNGLNVLSTSALKPISSSGISDNGSYLPMSNSPETSYNSQISSTQSQNDMYTPSGESSLFHDQSMRNDSTTDLSYSYGPNNDNSSAKRGSHSSAANAENSLPALANGHAYVPHNQSFHHPLEIRSLPHRPSSSSLQAV